MSDRVFLPNKTTAPNMNWRTPPEIYSLSRFLFTYNGYFLDAAATAENRLCRDHYDEATDALTQEPANTIIWCNPPYGRGIKHWARWAVQCAVRNCEITLLLPVSTSSRWWNEILVPNAKDIAFLTPRVQFIPPAGLSSPDCNRYDNVLIHITPESVGEDVADTHYVNWQEYQIPTLRRSAPSWAVTTTDEEAA